LPTSHFTDALCPCPRPPGPTGDNDATVLLKPRSGSRRWQHITSDTKVLQGPSAAETGRSSPVESNYTIILGSHRNSCLKFERDGELCCTVSGVPGAKLSCTTFARYWINYNSGAITVGCGAPGDGGECHRWIDPDPIPNIRFVGLSAWDKHVGYRNIQLLPALRPSAGRSWAPSLSSPSAADGGGVPGTLVETCCDSLLRSLSFYNVCAILDVADALAPIIDGLRAQAVDFAARSILQLGEEDPEGLSGLSAQSMGDIVRSECLVSC
jgi:hypothetical protein